MDRKDFLKKSSLLALGGIFFSKVNSLAETVAKPFRTTVEGNFTLPALPYAYEALEPHIDTLTMQIHHQKHHQAYVNNLNKAISEKENEKDLTTLLTTISQAPIAVRNNAGGHYNHSLFWTLMKPNGGGEPKGELASAINKHFGSFDEFKKKFAAESMSRFGSGWTWLVVDTNRNLVIGSTPNQDNPLMDLSELKGTPVLALDVWEHAYYLKHQNMRVNYITAWWNVVNWDKAEELFTVK